MVVSSFPKIHRFPLLLNLYLYVVRVVFQLQISTRQSNHGYTRQPFRHFHLLGKVVSSRRFDSKTISILQNVHFYQALSLVYEMACSSCDMYNLLFKGEVIILRCAAWLRGGIIQ